MEELAPEFEINIKHKNERSKWMKIRMVNQWNVESWFLVEKRTCEFSLENIAAEAVAVSLEDVREVEELDITNNTKKLVAHMWRDLKWREGESDNYDLDNIMDYFEHIII
jgi:hypothetical protein